MVGKTVEAAGAGRVVRKKARPDELAQVIAELLAGGPHRLAAARLGELIRASRGTETAADQVLDTVTNGVAAH